MAGFWRRQFQLPATQLQRWFDFGLGIAAPLVCLSLDPIVFRTFGAGQAPLLGNLRLFGFAVIALSIVTLAYYLLAQQGSMFVAGILMGGAIMSIALGIVMLPFTVIGMLIIVGFLGLTPFFTGFVFLRNAIRCWKQSSRLPSPTPALLRATVGLLLIVGVPAALHGSVAHLTRQAITGIESGSEQDFTRSVHTLKWLFYSTDELAFAYQETKDTARRARLARAFTDLTGGSIEARLAQLND